jgi:SAM-dependent methyltransferase
VSPAALEPDANEAATWDYAIENWNGGRGAAFLRAYSDSVNRNLLAAWLPSGSIRQVLKTDLFDEAVGDGLFPLLRSRAGRILGIDVSPAAVDAARARYPDLEARCADARRLPFADGSFDLVVSNSTLDHFTSLAEIETALRELHRVLETDGILLVTLDNAVNPMVALRNRLPLGALGRLGLVPYYVGATCGPRRLANMLRKTGFEVERGGAVMHFPRILARLLAAMGGGTRLLGLLTAFERLGRLPSRYLTGQFVAARAVKR